MPANKIDQDDYLSVTRLVAEICVEGTGFGTEEGKKSPFCEAARRLDKFKQNGGPDGNWVLRRWQRAIDLGYDPALMVEPAVVVPEDDELPDGLDVIRRQAAINADHIAKVEKSRNRMFPVRAEPFGVAFIGDPHLDNAGTDLEAFQRDLALLRSAKVRAVNMGDILDSFQAKGKLASKQAANRMSVSEAQSVARWMMRDAGIKWDVHLMGNHDQWLDDAGAALFSAWARDGGSRTADWMCGLTYMWEGGEYRVLAAHDFKGHSQYNPLHGLAKRALEDGWADLYVAGHRHEAAQGQVENGHRGRTYSFLRVKGYKRVDPYSHNKGFAEQAEGASAMVVINPLSPSKDGRAKTFLQIADGVLYLQALRTQCAQV